MHREGRMRSASSSALQALMDNDGGRGGREELCRPKKILKCTSAGGGRAAGGESTTTHPLKSHPRKCQTTLRPDHAHHYLQGHKESLQLDKDDSNVGNFLGLVKLMATCDPVMKEHLTHVESHPGSTSYLSPAVQNEFIHLMTSTVRQSLLRGICKAKYYGLMFDSTPDLAHREQMSQVVRYVQFDFERKTVRVRESFLGFIQLSWKDAESLTEDILKKLEKDGMELQDCQSQCYDNAAVMAGHRSGVSQRILDKNNLAVFVNCDNHSLNLVGVHAAKQDVMMVTFFGTLDAIYVFFSRSTQCWEKLRNAMPVSVKSESETRWSSRMEAVKPVNNHLEEKLQVLQDMTVDEDENLETRSDARHLCNHLLTYDFLTLLRFWNNILI
ncbi:uncharacterized protein LOC128346396 isoform X1 [Hemicordylus capensis]|uniref:uncharacterized protein LOC128346396 isoform X1 n=1 Tax=Hemicordylus capensis TaxID=884348 RepID=UPI002304ACBB|nr:uncharacterized protein LOC128346396 isoform X1 [Hemicordylus capensis]XP_053155629.1 uncharacterized protein LOC128346396 isoform X1 [Hemicordylus capensis]XP_053155630.1 uncharacterized protein LOC128346396 isoform X1 [Hemicordylus capensis]XP_053155631.1 uncharacterized protein LOC128346396 isoform X1 [Hemicordylus capensis]XP_053155632.1 uncharacterized protein LOC128346396 isoform X1 [Hemicordylus capensis]XP_053155633.1 uncharacterized protein LOC128346396 isoform X1 [Hemicordylus cap